MSGRRLVLIVTGLAVAGSMLATGCSTSNSATVTSTPSPASTDPFETPTPKPSPTTPTPSATASGSPTPSRTASSTATPSSTPTPSATPTVLAKPVSTHALVRGLGSKGKNRFTITYDPVVLCTKAGVKANEAPKQCSTKPARTAKDGSWTVRTTSRSVIVTLSSAVSGTLYPAGVSFDVTTKNLAKQKADDGVLFDWSTVTVPALLTVEKNEVTKVAGTRAAN